MNVIKSLRLAQEEHNMLVELKEHYQNKLGVKISLNQMVIFLIKEKYKELNEK